MILLKSSRSILFTLAAIVFALSALLGLGIYNIRVKNAETLRLLGVANSASEADSTARSIRTLQENSAEDLATFDALVLTGNKLVPLIESIERAGQAFGLDCHILSVSNIEHAESLEGQKIQIVVESQGAWASIFSFLEAIESLPQRALIDDLNLTNEDGSWRLRVVLSVFLFN